MARANDDVYLRLEPTLAALFAAGPPSRVYAGLFVYNARPPRPEDVRHPAGVDRDAWLASVKAWTLTRDQYPADVFPTFAQGNAYILSWDLADRLARGGPWPELPDDVLAGLVVDSTGSPRRVSVKTDYEFEGQWTPCSDDALWHFNIHFEHMYELHLAEPTTTRSAVEVAIDDDVLLVEVDPEVDDISHVSRAFAAAHDSLAGAGCIGDDSACLAGGLERALREARPSAASDRSRCGHLPFGVFCCG